MTRQRRPCSSDLVPPNFQVKRNPSCAAFFPNPSSERLHSHRSGNAVAPPRPPWVVPSLTRSCGHQPIPVSFTSPSPSLPFQPIAITIHVAVVLVVSRPRKLSASQSCPLAEAAAPSPGG
ncbi:hypothetical protein KC19_2G167500 [Ceratodon purpureus]|uniref:Uncharacterized protein n=1 Tax=Ceratodon purpureus TaxID=3225 RepID=A0A8T0IUS2_CERPU|nr:hypothetical protein KC19_2G167500 [Ceratodon purpureus]